MFRPALILFLAIALLGGCRTEKPAETKPLTETTTAPKAEPSPRTEFSEGLSTPESVLYDAEQDVYFVSNINGSPLATDDNGYISRVNAETLQSEAKWIDGAKPEVQLSAPKGMAIVGDDLWVADITTVRRFDRRSGAPKGEVAIPGATFLNDLAADGSVVYVSDSGMKAGANGFEGTGTDAIWSITTNKPARVAAATDLNRPNGLAVVNGQLWAVTFGSDEIFQIDQGKKGPVSHLPKGSLDGLVPMPDGSVLVSSWEGKAVYRGNPGAQFQAVVENVDSPADIGYDTKRGRVLVPHFMENRVTMHDIR